MDLKDNNISEELLRDNSHLKNILNRNKCFYSESMTISTKNSTEENDNSFEKMMNSNEKPKYRQIKSKIFQNNIKTFQNSRKYKTEICKNFELYQKCKFGENCCFAHGRNELRKKQAFNDFYKTKICKHFHRKGFCPYGNRCQYFHFQTNSIYKELLETLVKKINHGMNETKINLSIFLKDKEAVHSRLDIFKNLVPCGEDSLLKRFFGNRE